MEETKTEETIEDPVVEESAVEENPIEEEKPLEKQETTEELRAQRDKLYARLKREEDKTKSLESKVPVKSDNSLTLEAIKVGKKLEKYSEEEIDSIAKVIKSDNPNDILNALENPVIKQGIEVERKKVEDNKKVPDSSSPDFASGVKTWKDIQKFGVDEKGKAEFREFAEKEEKRKSTGI